MVIEIRVGSLQKLPVGDVVEVRFWCGMRSGRRFGFVSRSVGHFEFVFYDGSADRHQRPVFSDIWRFPPRLILISRRRRPAFCDSIEIKN